MNRFALVAVLALSVVMTSTLTLAGPTKRFDPVTATLRPLTFSNLRDGYRLFQEDCKRCHYRGNDQGAKFLYSESKTMRAWNRVFLQRYPQCAKTGAWSSVSKEDLSRLNDYLFANAVDTIDVNCYL